MTGPASLPTNPEEVERWLPVVGWEEAYEVSSLGRVKSLTRDVPLNGGIWRIRSRILRLNPSRGGYLNVNLNNKGKSQTLTVHLLVLKAFAGPRPEGMEGCHGPAGKLDNSMSNLRWDTPEANHADRLLHGTLAVGERHGIAKLTDEKVRSIRKGLLAGKSLKALAKDFGVGASTIWRIAKGETWRHVEAS